MLDISALDAQFQIRDMPTTILLVDGYNLIHRVPELRPSLGQGLEAARLALALHVSTWNRTHRATECVIVFDGDQRYAGAPSQRLSGVRCLFSRASHGGDDKIIELVRAYRGSGAAVTVVSDDNKVSNNGHALGATVRPSSFIMIAKAPKPLRGQTAKAVDGGRGIGSKAAAEIDKEFRKKFGVD
jgi:predicted RNA-binding protein with PIN domain